MKLSRKCLSIYSLLFFEYRIFFVFWLAYKKSKSRNISKTRQARSYIIWYVFAVMEFLLQFYNVGILYTGIKHLFLITRTVITNQLCKHFNKFVKFSPKYSND